MANIAFPLSLQTKEPMAPSDFLHGVMSPEDEAEMVPLDVQQQRNYARFTKAFCE